MNMVEIIDENQHPSPCKHGNIVDGHACYCHSTSPETPRKCHIWRFHGERDLSKWVKSDWDNGCPFFISK